MALKYNGTSPTAIKYNGTDLTVLKYGDTAVWGKPYALSITTSEGASVTVTRTSSPNQDASLEELTTGSVIYYGDVLTIKYTISSGYYLDVRTVNGTTFTSGQSFTVTSAINVVVTTVVAKSWHTVYTGSSSVSNNTTIMFGSKAFSPSITVPSGSTIIRITGSYLYNGTTTTLTNRTGSVGQTSTESTVIVSNKITVYAQQNALLMANVLAYSSGKTSTITITKLEAYY